MLTDEQKESLRGLNYFVNEWDESLNSPTYFDYTARLDDEGIPLFRSEADEDADRYGVSVTLEHYPNSIIIYYQFFIDSVPDGINYVGLDKIPENLHEYLKNSHEHIVENIFAALPELTFDAKENSRRDWRAICVMEVA